KTTRWERPAQAYRPPQAAAAARQSPGSHAGSGNAGVSPLRSAPAKSPRHKDRADRRHSPSLRAPAAPRWQDGRRDCRTADGRGRAGPARNTPQKSRARNGAATVGGKSGRQVNEPDSVVIDATAILAGEIEYEDGKHRADPDLQPVNAGDEVGCKGNAVEALVGHQPLLDIGRIGQGAAIFE